MVYIPKEVRAIICAYIDAFRVVDVQLEKCLDQYFAIEERAMRILDRFCHRYNCPLHRYDIKLRVEDIVQESGRLIELMLQHQTVLPVQRNMLTFLMSELNVDSFNLFLLPPFSLDPSPLISYTPRYNAYEHDDTHHYMPDPL